MNKLKRKVISTFNWIKFSLFVREQFGKDSSDSVLRVLNKFIELEAPLQKDTWYLGRNVRASVFLLKILTDSYLETKSGVVLSQIMTVLKNEIIEREHKNGRKQFPCRPIRRSNS